MTTDRLVVPAAFSGPPSSGNGGWVSGALAAFLPDAEAVRVRLAAPPPLEVRLTVEVSAGSALLRQGTTAVAQASVVDGHEAHPQADPDPFVGWDEADATGERYPGAADHPFPTCFVCSPSRDDPDALRLRPGPLDPGAWGAGRTAATWTPSARHDHGDDGVTTASVWAALDCPGGWTADIAGRPMVLGTVTGRILRRPRVAERCVVVGTARGGSGRKVFSTTTLWTADGERLASTAQVWIVLGS